MNGSIIEQYEGWLVDRSGRLSRMFGVDREDAYQTLAMYLLRWNSQKSAWFSAYHDFVRQTRESVSPVCEAVTISEDFVAVVELLDELESRLTPKQMAAVRLALEGLTTHEIADSMGVARRTVQGYLTVVKREILRLKDERSH